MRRPPFNETLIIIGGCVHCLETAAEARVGGARVTVVVTADRVMKTATSPKIAALFTAAHRASGVVFITHAVVADIKTGGVTLANGRTLSATQVIEPDQTPPPDPHRFTTTQFDLVLQSAGSWYGADTTLLRRREEGPGLTLLHTKSGRLIAIESVNDPETFAEAAALLAKRAHIDIKAAADGTRPLANAIQKLSAARARP